MDNQIPRDALMDDIPRKPLSAKASTMSSRSTASKIKDKSVDAGKEGWRLVRRLLHRLVRTPGSDHVCYAP